jgi:hypothetical protein
VRKRPAVLACSALGCTAVGVALATAGPAATGCTTHQCDSSTYDWFPAETLPDGGHTAGGFMIDENTYVSNAIDSDWLDYHGMTTIQIWFPPEVVGRAADLPLVWEGLDPTPNGGDAYVNGDNYAMAGGQLAIFNFLETAPGGFAPDGGSLGAVKYDNDDGGHAVGGGFSVTNGSCAPYFLRVEVHFFPVATGTSAAGDGGSPVDAQVDAGALDTLTDTGAVGTLADAGGDAVVGAVASLDAAADGSD